SNFRKKKFNYPIPQSFVNDISNEKDFNKFVKLVTSNDNLINLQRSLFKVDDNKNITHRTLFLLGINALKHNNKTYALKYFEYAYKKAYFQSDKDKVVFWQYLLNKDKLLLKKLSKSFSINIYSLYAKELLNVSIDNIVYDIKILNKESNFDTLDHFKWMEVLENTKKNFDEKKLSKYHKLFSSEDTLAHYAFILERFYKYKKQYFITPYKQILSKYDIERQVLIYSIAKQESHFIPTVASVATAQGVMQIMPFLSKDIARRINKPYNIYEQFVPKVNLEYSNIHLNNLSKQFNNNPLFMAYAYNGGAGYFKSQLKRNLFTKRGKYEPFMSIESVSYPETRNYGKKVLANYYIYNNHINKDNKIKLSTIFQNLIVPH
ncbi:MAG: lytic transglycosylase domain-containing protein, partial [Poseidonibacter sp.]|uniref:lytic transglycosylase domain-containing protein n=1 Tax=Poseidonibacter sp. TaxID=2321188 RepID=UPI00359E1405